jgi:heme oxygenase
MRNHSSPTDDATPRTFSQELNEAIRTEHGALNKLITARLPLCLPPYTNNPLLYTKGMIVFGSIYRVFEAQMATVLSTRTPEDRIRQAIAYVSTPSLHRSTRLDTDMIELRHRLEPQHRQQLLVTGTKAALHTQRIDPNIPTQTPHVLLAYAWTMYLAIFSGGRWIRKQLRDAGEGFWMGEAPLSFWEFDGEQDGEDIKARFKEGFEEAVGLLTREEREDVIRQARKIFELCDKLVGELDKLADETDARGSSQSPGKGDGYTAKLWNAFGFVGLFYLLKISWQLLTQTYASWRSSVSPVVDAKAVHTE